MILKNLHLIENKITNFKINKVYAPAWTTDWMSKKTKEKLKNYGISPPSNQVVCPQCNSINTNMISEFVQQLVNLCTNV